MAFQMLGVHVVFTFRTRLRNLRRPSLLRLYNSHSYELASILDRVTTYREPIFMTGEFNVRLDHRNDPHANQLRVLVDFCGQVLYNTGSTHKFGGTLEVVVTRADTGCPDCVSVVDIGLSVHHLLQWSTTLHVRLPTIIVCSRPWPLMNCDRF